MIIQFERQKA